MFSVQDSTHTIVVYAVCACLCMFIRSCVHSCAESGAVRMLNKHGEESVLAEFTQSPQASWETQ